MGKSRPEKEPHPTETRVLGLSAPSLVLPWTTYADSHDELEDAANMSLADLAARHTLVVYFTPSEDEGDGPTMDTMSRVYQANDGAFTQFGVRTVGVSSQTALEQARLAVAEEFPQLMLADNYLALADDLNLPTVEINGRDEYEPLAMIIHEGIIVHVVYPIASPAEHIDEVLRWLAKHSKARTSPYTNKGLIEQAQIYLEQLRDESGYTASLSVLDGAEIVCLRCLFSSKGAPSVAHAGPDMRLPAYCTATGKVLLAFRPADELAQLLTTIKLERHTEATFTDLQALTDELETTGETMFAVSDGEYIAGLQAIATGVRDHTGQVIAALSISAQSFDAPFEFALVREQGCYLKEASDALSAKLGFES